MNVRHRVRLHTTCPVNGDPDHYTCDVFVTDGLLYCEAVLAAAAEVTGRPVTQEDLTQGMADRLGCKVRTRGTHCQGRVETVCVCYPKGRE
jgi:hypothetical protein